MDGPLVSFHAKTKRAKCPRTSQRRMRPQAYMIAVLVCFYVLIIAITKPRSFYQGDLTLIPAT